jgi:hypothetical protein
LFPTIILVHFVGPWLALSLNIRKLVRFIVVIVKLTITVRKAFILPFLLLLEKLSLVVLFVVDLNEAWKSFVGCDATFTLQDVDHDAV